MEDVIPTAEATPETPVETPKPAPASTTGSPAPKAKAKSKKVAKVVKRGRPAGSKNTPVVKAKRTRKASNTADQSVSQLEKELARKQKALAKAIAARRSSVERELAKVDAELASLGDVPAKPKAKKAGRPAKVAKAAPKGKAKKAGSKRSSMTMADACAKVLKRRKNGASTKEIAETVAKVGYESKSKNLAPMVAQALSDQKRFKRVSRGVYAIA